MKGKKLPRTLTTLQPGQQAPKLTLEEEKTDSYSLQRGPSSYLIVRAGTVISGFASHPGAGPIVDAAGEVVDPGEAELYSRVDATLLRAGVSRRELRSFAEKALERGCRNVCVFPAHMEALLDMWPSPATVVSFPHGSDTDKMKAEEIKGALSAGAGEIDLVANRSLIHSGDWESLRSEIEMCAKASGDSSLKVIIESGELSPEEIHMASKVCVSGGADCIKTSTGTTEKGASVEAVEIIRAAEPKIKIKASGGIRTRQQAAGLLRAGADIFGLSNLDAFSS